jgi:calcineurin-like phosphoesterase
LNCRIGASKSVYGYQNETVLKKFRHISAALRQGSNGGSDFAGFLVVRNEHHRRDASLFSIAVQFPKLDVAG